MGPAPEESVGLRLVGIVEGLLKRVGGQRPEPIVVALFHLRLESVIDAIAGILGQAVKRAAVLRVGP